MQAVVFQLVASIATKHASPGQPEKELPYAITHNLGMSFKFHLAADNFLSSSDTELACLLAAGMSLQGQEIRKQQRSVRSNLVVTRKTMSFKLQPHIPFGRLSETRY
jgi:hypothetical protein